MLERLAAWFLNTYVADYVGNVDTDQLSIGLLKGINCVNSNCCPGKVPYFYSRVRVLIKHSFSHA